MQGMHDLCCIVLKILSTEMRQDAIGEDAPQYCKCMFDPDQIDADTFLITSRIIEYVRPYLPGSQNADAQWRSIVDVLLSGRGTPQPSQEYAGWCCDVVGAASRPELQAPGRRWLITLFTLQFDLNIILYIWLRLFVYVSDRTLVELFVAELLLYMHDAVMAHVRGVDAGTAGGSDFEKQVAELTEDDIAQIMARALQRFGALDSTQANLCADFGAWLRQCDGISRKQMTKDLRMFRDRALELCPNKMFTRRGPLFIMSTEDARQPPHREPEVPSISLPRAGSSLPNIDVLIAESPERGHEPLSNLRANSTNQLFTG